MNLICYCDGGYNRVSGTGYGSFSIDTPNSYTKRTENYQVSTSSTDSEYRALISLLSYVKENYPEDISIIIYSDSKIMVNQLNLLWLIHAENLQELFQTAFTLLTSIKNHAIIWTPRKTIVKELGH